MFDDISLSLVLPTVLGLCAFCLWMAMLVMFKPKAQVHFREESIILDVTNARILGIERIKDKVIVHIDREVARVIGTLAA